LEANINKYVIDIDGTICSNNNGDYKNSVPYKNRILFINELFESGNTIVYFTARGMGSTKNNRAEAIDKWFEFTKKQLDGWGAKYNELILGKPSADFYIDDKNLSIFYFFNNSGKTK